MRRPGLWSADIGSMVQHPGWLPAAAQQLVGWLSQGLAGSPEQLRCCQQADYFAMQKTHGTKSQLDNAHGLGSYQGCLLTKCSCLHRTSVIWSSSSFKWCHTQSMVCPARLFCSVALPCMSHACSDMQSERPLWRIWCACMRM